jgi:hypothetical protein
LRLTPPGSASFLFSCFQSFLWYDEFLSFAAADAEADDLAGRCGDALAVVLKLCYAFVVFSEDSLEFASELGIRVVE